MDKNVEAFEDEAEGDDGDAGAQPRQILIRANNT